MLSGTPIDQYDHNALDLESVNLNLHSRLMYEDTSRGQVNASGSMLNGATKSSAGDVDKYWTPSVRNRD